MDISAQTMSDRPSSIQTRSEPTHPMYLSFHTVQDLCNALEGAVWGPFFTVLSRHVTVWPSKMIKSICNPFCCLFRALELISR